jgi:hypothetical protein
MRIRGGKRGLRAWLWSLLRRANSTSLGCNTFSAYGLSCNAYTDDGPVAMFLNFSEGRIREEKRRIHLYLWFDEGEPDTFMFFSETHPDHHATLCRYFDIDQARIKRL